MMVSENLAAVTSSEISRRTALQKCATGLLAAGALTQIPAATLSAAEEVPLKPRPWIKIRGIYGGFPEALLKDGKTPQDFGVNAIWVGSGGLNQDQIKRYHDLGLKVFAEYNSMHFAGYLKEHPEAAPVGVDGKPSPAPHGWQGISPFHAGYRKNRMEEFHRVLETYDIDGIWLDYHHSHASWERADPLMPDTDFCETALHMFRGQTGIKLPENTEQAAQKLLSEHKEEWTQFRCDVFTDWVREYREILNAVRPEALLGTFHCPWSLEDYEGAIRHKLAIDLPAQAKFLDILSTMPYHARFGYPQDPAWISRQTQSLGKLLGLKGAPGEPQQIWPIVQLADWGETVAPEQIQEVIDYGTRQPATGVMAFHWSGISRQWPKMEKLGQVYRQIAPANS